MGTFPERFTADSRQAGFDRLTVSAGRAQLDAEDLECMHAELAVSLTLYEHPLVVVIRQKLCRRPDGPKVALLRRTAIEQLARKIRYVIQVDMNEGRQAEVVRVSLDEPV